MRVAEAVAATIYEAYSPQIKAQQTYHEDHFYPRRYDCREKSFEYDFHEEKGGLREGSEALYTQNTLAIQEVMMH